MGGAKQDNPKDDGPHWWTETVDRAVVLRFRREIALADIEIQHTWQLWDFLDRLAKGPHRILHVQFPTRLFDHHGLVRFWEHVRGIANDAGRAHLELARDDYAMQRWITYMRDSRLFTVGAYQDELDINFLGTFLACDYRVASENFVIVNCGRPLGTGPGTAVPWLLTHILKPGDAMQILLSCERVAAERAFELGLIHRITNSRSHAEDSLRITQALASAGTANLIALKRALATSSESLDKYFQVEGAGFSRLPRFPVDPPICAQCGYNLTGNVSGRCPECGTDIDEIDVGRR